MITRQDLEQAISECQGVRNPNASTCIKLASFLTLKRELFGDDEKSEHPTYSFSPAPEQTISYNSGSEFARVINGRDSDEVLPIIEELVETLSIIQPRLYSAFMEKLG